MPAHALLVNQSTLAEQPELTSALSEIVAPDHKEFDVIRLYDPGLKEGSALSGSKIDSDHQSTQQLSTSNKVREPHSTSYFIPGKISGKRLRFLLDSWCTTNILSHQVFDRLPSTIKAKIEPLNSSARLAEGTAKMFAGQINLEGRPRVVPIQARFLVTKIKDDAI